MVDVATNMLDLALCLHAYFIEAHRITEVFGLEETLTIICFHTTLPWAGHLPLKVLSW